MLRECAEQRVCVLLPGIKPTNVPDSGPARVVVPFFGGADSREALLFALQTAGVSDRKEMHVQVLNYTAVSGGGDLGKWGSAW